MAFNQYSNFLKEHTVLENTPEQREIVGIGEKSQGQLRPIMNLKVHQNISRTMLGNTIWLKTLKKTLGVCREERLCFTPVS